MKTEQRKKVAADFFDAYKNQDVARAVSYAAENGTFRYVPLGSNGMGNIKGQGITWEGIAGALIEAFPDLTNEVQSITVDDEGNAIARVFIGGTQEKEILGIPSKRQHYWLEHLFILHINGQGLIDDITCFWDNWDWFQQIGYHPAPG